MSRPNLWVIQNARLARRVLQATPSGFFREFDSSQTGAYGSGLSIRRFEPQSPVILTSDRNVADEAQRAAGIFGVRQQCLVIEAHPTNVRYGHRAENQLVDQESQRLVKLIGETTTDTVSYRWAMEREEQAGIVFLRDALDLTAIEARGTAVRDFTTTTMSLAIDLLRA